jgi:DNA polymerase-3 subunit gamma/tau
MSYQVLARKWRPQDFSHLIGQEPIVAALRNALREGRIAQAYVFSGIRGVGKTTAARLLAKALNCEHGPTPEPCNACAACKEISAGTDLDVLEVDAATYSKVEQVRDLTESLRYGPARDRYKVVVLDEVHRLSRQAFDALLKIVEEPPPRVVFIFATTEIDAVPATILSRCQEYPFRRVPAGVLGAHLREICAAEGIEASDASLRLLARAGEGSVRDAVALLDQLATFGGSRIDETEAARLVGGLDLALFRDLLAAILEGESASVVALVGRVEEFGWDPRHVFAHFLSYCRSALHLSLGGEAATLDLPAEEAQELQRLVGPRRYEHLLRLLHYLIQSEPVVRRSDVGTLALEIALLRAAELPKLKTVEEALAGHAAPALGGPREVVAPAVPLPSVPPTMPAPTMPALAPSAPSAPEAAAPDRALAEPDSPVGRFLDAVSKRRPALAARLSRALWIRLDGETLRIAFEPRDRDVADSLRRSVHKTALDEAARESLGEAVRWAVEEETGAPAAAERGAGVNAIRLVPPPVHDHPTVQAVLEIFGGTFADVTAEPAKKRSEP